MLIKLSVNGDAVVARKLEALARVAQHPFGAQIEMLNVLMRMISLNFQSQGRRGGGSWKQVSRKWLRRKERMGLDPRVGYATHMLHDSLTKLGHPWQEVEFSPYGFDIGSSLEYAQVFRLGWPGRNIPARDYAKVSEKDTRILATVLVQHMMRAFRDAN